ncbi:MAG TPA: hypothetical protein VHB51_04220 [Candidatus Saccharimonadales bacterium]|nr:hypothetical protein [Candidatus Saccharimonadales bacterium]
MPKRRDLWDRVWKDEHGDVVIVESPNRWIIAWVVLVTLFLLSSSNAVQNFFWLVSLIPLTIWAYLETTQGVNYFRRALGVIGFLLVVAATFVLGIF